MLTRYVDVVAALSNRQLSVAHHPQSEELAQWGEADLAPLYEMLSLQMLFSDPPAHTRLRSLVRRAFTPRAVESLRPRVESIAAELLDEMASQRSVDLVAAYAYPLPIAVIAEILGVPPEDRGPFREWSHALTRIVEGGDLTPREKRRAQRDLLKMADYFRHKALRRRPDFVESLFDELANSAETGDRLTESELLANCILILAAGHETTRNLIANGILTLLRHPDALEDLRNHPEILPSAVEELLRFESPVQETGRVAREDTAINGMPVHRGEWVSIMLGATNRDPAVFQDPDRLDLRRAENPHVAFGHGIHFCLGAALARMEGQIAIGMLIERFPSLRLLDPEPRWISSSTFRALEALPLALE